MEGLKGQAETSSQEVLSGRMERSVGLPQCCCNAACCCCCYCRQRWDQHQWRCHLRGHQHACGHSSVHVCTTSSSSKAEATRLVHGARHIAAAETISLIHDMLDVFAAFLAHRSSLLAQQWTCSAEPQACSNTDKQS